MTSPFSHSSFRAINQTRGTVVCEYLEDAGGLAGQSRGLLGRERLEAGHGMLFDNGRFTPFMWMHMFFMKFAIDIVFLGRGGRVLKISRELRPWRVSAMVFGARRALELEAGAAAASGTRVGDIIAIESAIESRNA
ncbi:MAG TPA: DUF192 domain-containing protein [Candidatus Binataceae bacterium]|nr:DUF192 domain-containing protein [Candidatus Binataceae bacterium]